MKKIIFVSVLICILALGINFAKADSWTFATIPADGVIEGEPGAIIGWGYTISNLSDTDWLVLTGLNAGSFTNAIATDLFDEPILAPATTASEIFDASSQTGLYAITLDTLAHIGEVNTGSFILSAEWWDGDPFGVGQFVTIAKDQSHPYTATVVSSSPVPEPATVVLMGFGSSFMGIGIKRLRKKLRKTK
jgi:hypothetical protein